ncbi:MAG TPA: UbiD family decarboxylase [Verrucomicrobiota bacterium]|nr:UbiD family decarboxylase [Verrucomicrobiota bacterium]
MAFESFRKFLDKLEGQDELKRVSQQLATELEITAAANIEMKKPGGGKALLIEKPTVNGEQSPFPVAINTMGSWNRMAIALNVDSVDSVAKELDGILKIKPPVDFKEAIKLFTNLLSLRNCKPKFVKDGLCKEVVHKFDPQPRRTEPWQKAPSIPELEKLNEAGNFPTLLNIPILKCWQLDAGRFITLPCVVTKDPDTGERNVGMYRMQVYDSQTTGMHWQMQKVGARHGRTYFEKGERMPVSVFLGGDPVFPFCASAPLPDGMDEYLLAGFLRKKPVELVKCETNDIEVPANADFVIEGYIDPQEPLREEGPFGDHTGFYTMPEPYPVFHITAITHRKDAVYPATIVGKPPMEDFYLGNASLKIFLPVLKMTFPELVDIALPAEGVFHNLLFASIKKTYPMQAYKIMYGLWGMGQMMFTKYIVIVDDDVDVNNTSEVLFKLCSNTDPQRDCVFTKGPADVLDHATDIIGVGTKLGIDATRKLQGEGFKRSWPPEIKMKRELIEKVIRILEGKR